MKQKMVIALALLFLATSGSGATSAPKKKLKPLQYDTVIDEQVLQSDRKSIRVARVVYKDRWGFADVTDGVMLTPPEYDTLNRFEQADDRGKTYAATVRKNNKWGYVRIYIGYFVPPYGVGLYVIKPQFDEVKNFNWRSGREIARAKLDGKWGCINTDGRFVIPRLYEEIGDFRDNIAKAKRKGKWGYIDTFGNEIIAPAYDEVGDLFKMPEDPEERDRREKLNTKYLVIERYSEGMAGVMAGDKWGFIDETGKEVVPVQYETVGLFHEGKAYVRKNGKSGTIDKTGKEIVKVRYDVLISVGEGLVIAGVKNEHEEILYGVVERATGREIAAPRYRSARDSKEGMAAVGVRSSGNEHDILYGFIDSSGKEIVPPRYDKVQDFHEGLAAVGMRSRNDTTNLLFGFVDKSGKEIIRPQYQAVGNFREGLAAVRVPGKDGKWTFIDKMGKKLFPPRYDAVASFSEGMAAVNRHCPVSSRSYTPDIDDSYFNRDVCRITYEDGKWGFIDRTGKEVITLQYNSVSPFRSGYADAVKVIKRAPRGPGGSFSCLLIDKRGKLGHRPEPQKKQEPMFKPGYVARVKLNGKFGYVDGTGREITPLKYEELPDTSAPFIIAKFVRVKADGKYGYLDAKGIEVVPTKYDEAPVDLYGNGYGRRVLMRVTKNGKFGYLARETGQEVVPPRYDEGPVFLSAVRTKVKRDGKWGYIDTEGREVSTFVVEEDPCAFVKKKGDHYVFSDQTNMRSKPEPASDSIMLLPSATRINVGSPTKSEFTRGDVTDMWYEVTSSGKTGYVWGGDMADSAFTVFMGRNKLLLLIRNRTNGTDQCYKPKFEMKMLLDGKVLSEYSGHPFDGSTNRVTSVEYVPLEGFSAPLHLLKIRFEFIGYKDEYARSGAYYSYFYIDDGKLNKVLDVGEEMRGEGKFKDHKFVTELKLPDNRERVDRIIYSVYSSKGFLSKELFDQSIYQWDWDKKTFNQVR